MIQENMFEIIFFIGVVLIFAGVSLFLNLAAGLIATGSVLIPFSFVMIILESRRFATKKIEK